MSELRSISPVCWSKIWVDGLHPSGYPAVLWQILDTVNAPNWDCSPNGSRCTFEGTRVITPMESDPLDVALDRTYNTSSQTRYRILSADINSALNEDGSQGIETFSVAVRGVNDTDLRVNCSVEWNPSRAKGCKSVTVPMDCTDPSFIVSMTRETVLDYLGWDVTIQQRYAL